MKGRRLKYSEAELRFVSENRAMARVELHAAFAARFNRDDVTVDHIKWLCTRKGWITRERWSAGEDAQLRELYPHVSSKVVADRIGRELTSIYARAKKLGLAKTDEYLASPAACRLRRGDSVGAAHRFPKGHRPANKGLRRPGFAPGRMAETQFKKGVATNWKPIGTERLVDGYRYTKVSDVRNVPWTRNWRATHILKWEELHGPFNIRTHALKCIDGDKQNTNPANWELIPRSLLLALNRKYSGGGKFDRAPADVKPLMMAAAKLTHAIHAKRTERARG